MADDQTAGSMPRCPVLRGDAIKRRALMLPPTARDDALLTLPADTQLGEAMDADFAPQPGVLSKDGERFANALLDRLLRTLGTEPQRQSQRRAARDLLRPRLMSGAPTA